MLLKEKTLKSAATTATIRGAGTLRCACTVTQQTLSFHTAVLLGDPKAVCRLQLSNPSKFPDSHFHLSVKLQQVCLACLKHMAGQKFSLDLTQDSI